MTDTIQKQYDIQKRSYESINDAETMINTHINEIVTNYNHFLKVTAEYKHFKVDEDASGMRTIKHSYTILMDMYNYPENGDLYMILNNIRVVMTYLNSGYTDFNTAASKVKKDYKYQYTILDIELRVKLMCKFSLYIKRIFDQNITLPSNRKCFSYGVLKNLNDYCPDLAFRNEYASISNFLIAINVLYIYGVLDNNKDDNLEPKGIIKSLKDFIIRIDKILGIVIPRV